MTRSATLFIILSLFPILTTAQTYRRITTTDEVEPDAYYIIGGYYADHPDSVFVMARQSTTGTSISRRAATTLPLDTYNRITPSNETAVFQLEQSGSSYYFRDTRLDAYLAYNSTKAERYTSIYTLTDDEITNATTNTKEWYKSFTFNDDYPDDSRTFIQTKEKISVSSERTGTFGIEIDPNFSLFRLYYLENYGDSLFLFKQTETPELVSTDDADWTFYGDWLADTLYSLNYADAQRIDFSEISLPSKPDNTDAISMPASHVWTYVSSGDADLLPDGWPNIIEITDKDADVQGTAATQIVGNDSCIFGPKYTFTIPADKEIIWYRTANDDGWHSAAFPFDVELVTWGSTAAEQVDLECLTYARTTSQGALFQQASPDAAMLALQPFLWRPVDEPKAFVCFSASNTTVYASSDTLETDDGFYPSCCRHLFSEPQTNLYVLADDGLSFVRPDAGSRLASCRAYLISGNVTANIRIINATTSVSPAGVSNADNSLIPFYHINGILAGRLPAGAEPPAQWPNGIYVTPLGKVLKK